MTHDLTRCQSCGAGRNLGKICLHCGAPYPPPGAITDTDADNNTSIRQSAPLSSRFQIDHVEDGSIVVKISNRSLGNWMVLAFMAFWCFVIVKVFWINVFIAIVTLPLLAFGAFFLYLFALTGLLNRAVIRADQSSLSLYHSPLPVPWKSRFACR